MNGFDAIVEYARRSHENAEKASNAALRVEAAYEKTQREIFEIRREMRHGFEALNSLLSQSQRPAHFSLAEEDWEDSPTGSHKQISKHTFDAWMKRRDESANARKWRKAVATAGKIALALALIVLGWIVRHVLGSL